MAVPLTEAQRTESESGASTRRWKLRGAERRHAQLQAMVSELQIAARAPGGEERYSLVVQGSGDGIWGWDLTTGGSGTTGSSDAGLSRSEVVSFETYMELVTGGPPESHRFPDRAPGSAAKVDRDRDPFEEPLRRLRVLRHS